MNINDKYVAQRLRRLAEELQDLAEMLDPEVERDYDDDDNEPEEDSDTESPQEIGIKISINDRYRFRRELFGNSDAEMNDTLQLISAMQSADEVTDYLVDDLRWNVDDEIVKDFIRAVTERFNDHPTLLI